MKIDAFAHISPIRYLERVEDILAGPSASAAVREHGPWLREDPVLYDLDARERALEPFGDYRQVLVLGAPPIEELGEPAVTRQLAQLANDEMAGLVRDRECRHVRAALLRRSQVSLQIFGTELRRLVDRRFEDRGRIDAGKDRLRRVARFHFHTFQRERFGVVDLEMIGVCPRRRVAAHHLREMHRVRVQLINNRLDQLSVFGKLVRVKAPRVG